MKVKTVIKIVSGKSNKVTGSINKIKLDSREVNKNDLFIAINSGINYIDEVIKKGAIVIAEIDRPDIIKVDSSINALMQIAEYIRDKHNPKVVAITGSNGKTTTKELIFDILSKKYKVLKNEKNKNNNIGLSETLLNLNNHDIAVLELGMNHKNEINDLSKMCKPDYSIITNIGTAHIGNMGNLNKTKEAKLEIKEHSKKLIVNGDDKKLKNIKCDKMSIKQLTNIKYYIDRTEFYFNNTHFVFNVPGKHLLLNVLLAIKMGLEFKISINDIKDAIKNYKTMEGRMNIIKNNFTIIDDCYNASYESMMGSLELLELSPDFKYIILGDMLELGKYSKKYHKKINNKLKIIKNKQILLIGEYTKYIKGIYFKTNDEIINYLNKQVLDNKVILIKGSHKFNLKEIVDNLSDL